MNLLKLEVLNQKKDVLPDKFGIIFDGGAKVQDTTSQFLLGSVAMMFPILLLAFRPFPDYEAENTESEYRMDANAHKK